METMVGACGFRRLFSERAWTKQVSGAQGAGVVVGGGGGVGDGVGVAEGGAVGSRGRGDSARGCGGGFLRKSWKRARGGRMSGMDRGCDTGGSGDVIELGISAEGSGRDSGGGDGEQGAGDRGRPVPMGCWMSGRRDSGGSGWAGGSFAPWEQRPGGSRDADKFGEGPDGAAEMEPRDEGPVVGGLNSEMVQRSWGGVRMEGTRGPLRCGIWRDILELRMGFCGAGVLRSGEDLGGLSS